MPLEKEKSIAKILGKAAERARVFYSREGDTRIRFVTAGRHPHNTVVFVHGSPGGWSDYASYFTNDDFFSKTSIIALDRPGYGGSDPGLALVELKSQSDRIHTAVSFFLKKRPAVWVGHSFGGPLVARIAMDHPQSVRALILVGASIDPELEVVRWYQKLLHQNWVRPFIPSFFEVSNEEIHPLKGELSLMLPLWKEIAAPVTVIHGDKDMLVPVANADFARRMIKDLSLRTKILPGVNHFIPWTHPKVLGDEVLGAFKNER